MIYDQIASLFVARFVEPSIVVVWGDTHIGISWRKASLTTFDALRSVRARPCDRRAVCSPIVNKNDIWCSRLEWNGLEWTSITRVFRGFFRRLLACSNEIMICCRTLALKSLWYTHFTIFLINWIIIFEALRCVKKVCCLRNVNLNFDTQVSCECLRKTVFSAMNWSRDQN